MMRCLVKSNSLEEYEEKAVSLALNKPKLQALTKELRASRLTCPLFDTMRWVSLGSYLHSSLVPVVSLIS